jgi:group II intron reverse transcriptase/maturase/CRISPR-associated endonuclease Cas1
MTTATASRTIAAPPEQATTHDVRDWIGERVRAGRPVAVLGEDVQGGAFVRIEEAPPVFWGDPSPRAVAEVLLRAVGVAAARNWPEILEVLLAGLREIRAESLFALPRLVEDLAFRRAEAERLGNPLLREAWRNEFPGGPDRLAALSECLHLLLESGPVLRVVGSEGAPLPGVSYCIPLAETNAVLAQALLVTSFTQMTRAGRLPALAIRLPKEGGLTGDDPLRHAISEFPGEVAFIVQGEREIARDERAWVRRSGTVFEGQRRVRLPKDAGRSGVANLLTPSAAPIGDLFLAATELSRLEEGWSLVQARRGGGGTDRITIATFEATVGEELPRLARELREQRYRPRPLRRVWVPKGNGELRALGIPAIRDRVVQAAVLLTLGARFEEKFLDCSFGYRPGRNAHQAIALLEGLRDDGFEWVVNADIRKFFDRIPHEPLVARLEATIADEGVIALLRSWFEVRTAGEPVRATGERTGIPQGSPISPLLANIYLHPLDVAMTRRGAPWIRYADDTLCLAPTRVEAEESLRALGDFVTRDLHLELKSEKSGIASFAEGFDFLGFRFEGREKGICRERRVEYRKRLLAVATARGLDRRTQIARIRREVEGFRSYFLFEDPKTQEELSELETWSRGVMKRFLRIGPAELAWIGSLLDPPKSDEEFRRDWYTATLVEERAIEQAAPEPPTEPPAQAEPGESAAAPDAARKSAAESGPDPEDQEAPEDIAPNESSAAEPERLASLFLSEGYAKEDLREFLRLGAGEEEPILSEDGSLFVALHGCALGKVSQQLVVRKARVDIFHVALRDLKHVAIQAVGVVVSSTLLRELAKRGIPLHFLDWRGVPYADVHAPSRESPAILRGQLRAYETGEGVAIAREMLTAKGQNQAQLLKLYARYRAHTNPALGHLLEAAIAVMERNVAAFAAVDGPSIEAVRGRFLAIEGRIAAAHFRAIAALLGPEWGFTTRTRQKEGFDAVNSTLDYLYGLLYTTCHRSLAAAGLDPRLGFVHTDGPEGKLSLLYDFVEEFRALGADRPALALLTRGSKITKTRDGRLSIPTRRRLLRAYARNLAARCRYRGERRSLAEIIEAQARSLAEILEKPGRRRYHGFRYNH